MLTWLSIFDIQGFMVTYGYWHWFYAQQTIIPPQTQVENQKRNAPLMFRFATPSPRPCDS